MGISAVLGCHWSAMGYAQNLAFGLSIRAIDMRYVVQPFVLLVLAIACTPTACSPTRSGPQRDDQSASSASDVGVSAAARNAAIFAGPPMPPPTAYRAADGGPGPEYWQQRVDYTIEATLDAGARRITGSQVMVYTNNSPQDLSVLWINLEQNLFRKESDGARMTRPSGRFGNRDGFAGGFENLNVRVDGAPASFNIYGTVGRIDLPTPIQARGGNVQVEISWAFNIPAYGSDRMGVDDVEDGAIFQIAQWFPCACVFDDVHGWNTLPYLGQGEFYTNFGSYDVRLTVPASHVVAATGELQNADEVLPTAQRERLSTARSTGETVLIRAADEPMSGGQASDESANVKTWHFAAKDVRTFAWASSSAFVWDACFVPGGGIGSSGDPGRGGGTLCQSFYPKEAAALWGAEGQGGGSTQMLRRSLEHYGKMWYAYPYPSASNVNGIVGGMEYPMILFCGGRSPDGERGLWGVTTHELGHNWFPMMINTDERRHAWMDEGFNTFMNYYATLERYPDDLPRRGNPRRWARDHRKPTSQPIDLPADQVEPGTLGDQQYGKTATGLVLLREGVLGPDRFDRAFREYLGRWAFKSPRPWDFFRTMQDVSGEELGWFWRGWFYETGVLDQSIATVMQPGGAAGGDAGESRSARVTIENRGELVMPVVFKVTYDDETTEVRHLPVAVWFSSNSWQTQWDTRDAAGKVRFIQKLELDPEENYPDINLKNDAWQR